jgi:hypothetical protein
MSPSLSPRTDREGMPSTRNSAEHFANVADIVNDEAMWTTTPLPIWQLRAARQARNEAEWTPFDWRLHRFHEAERLSLSMPPWRRDAALRAAYFGTRDRILICQDPVETLVPNKTRAGHRAAKHAASHRTQNRTDPFAGLSIEDTTDCRSHSVVSSYGRKTDSSL